MHLGCCSTFGKRKNTLACGSSIFTLSESLATSLVHGHVILHGKPFGIPLLLTGEANFVLAKAEENTREIRPLYSGDEQGKNMICMRHVDN
jgi:hypothetical protein